MKTVFNTNVCWEICEKLSESLVKPSYVIKLLNKLIKNFERFNDFTKILNYFQLFDDPFNLETVPEEYQSEVILLRSNQIFTIIEWFSKTQTECNENNILFCYYL